MRKQKRPKKPQRLYIVELDGGTLNPRFAEFYTAVSDLRGRGPDYAGIRRLAIVSSDYEGRSLWVLVTQNMGSNASDVTVEEITTATMKPNGAHRAYIDTVRWFQQYSEFPNIDI